MAERDSHPVDAIHALVDGRLDAREVEGVQRHAEACARCRAELDGAAGIKRIMKEALPDPRLPPGLETRIRASLDAHDAAGGRRGTAWFWLVPAAAVLVLLFAYLQRPMDGAPAGERIVGIVAADYLAVRDGGLETERTSAGPAELERYFAQQGIDFETRVFDLGMMGFELAGGRVQRLAERPSALFAYRGPGGVLMVCRMYPGRVDELPEPGRVVEQKEIVFRVYERNGLTLVFWQEGDVVCVLASDASAQQVIDLAIAKSVKV